MKKEEENYWRKVIKTINLLKRYFNNELNSSEREEIDNWDFNRSDSNQQSAPLDPKMVEERGMQVKQRVFNKLDIAIPEKKQRSKKRVAAIRPLFIKYASIAAIVLAVVSVSYFMFNTNSSLQTSESTINRQALFAATGDLEVKEAELPDGTKVHLNTNSQITFIEDDFGKDKREIWLNGEAYFDVAKDADKPFIINSREVSTTVKGTSFNVKAYEDIGEISVTVETGLVEVSADKSVLGLLTPNKQLVFSENDGSHSITAQNGKDATAWIDKRLVLHDANVNELTIRLRQIWGMQVVVEGDVLANSKLNANYPANTKINSVLQGIGELYGVEYSIDEKNQIIRIY